MMHITIPILLVMIFFVVIFRFKEKVNIKWGSLFVAVLLAFCGYIYQSGENRKMQDLQYKRDSYANLMEKLAIFKISGSKTSADARDFTNIYFRSWAETSDEINSLLLKYLKAYKGWIENKNETTEKAEKQAFDELTQQIKKEINPNSRAKFVPYNFKLPDTNN